MKITDEKRPINEGKRGGGSSNRHEDWRELGEIKVI